MNPAASHALSLFNFKATARSEKRKKKKKKETAFIGRKARSAGVAAPLEKMS